MTASDMLFTGETLFAPTSSSRPEVQPLRRVIAYEDQHHHAWEQGTRKTAPSWHSYVSMDGTGTNSKIISMDEAPVRSCALKQLARGC